MMINKRLIGTVGESKKYIAGNVACQWVSLAANISMMAAIARMLQGLYTGTHCRSRHCSALWMQHCFQPDEFSLLPGREEKAAAPDL